MEDDLNPEYAREQETLGAFAEVWRKIMDDDPDDFARKVKLIEEDKDLADLFESLKEYRWDLVESILQDKQILSQVSKRMGGVPKEAKQRADKLRKMPLTLQEACKFGDLKALQRYLDETNGKPDERDVDAKDHRGITCLGYAVGANRMNIAKVLVEAKADPSAVDSDGNTALHYAAGYGRTAMVEYLQGLGLNLSKENSRGMTPLACATANKQKATIALLTK